jgi:hypothetical protein
MHTGANLAPAVFSLLAEFGVTGKLTGITSDGASNDLTLMAHLEHLFMEYRTENVDAENDIATLFNRDQWSHCLSHVNNLLSTTFLKSSVMFADILIKIRKKVSIICLSDMYRDKFSQVCKNHLKSFVMPPGEIVTRWNSTYELLLWFLNLKQPLVEYLKMIYADASERIRGELRVLGSTAPFGQVLPDDMELMLSTQEWRELGLMKQLLEPFYNFTLKFNRTQACPSEALTTFFYIEEFLRDMGEASTPSAIAAFFARHGMKACRTELSQELRDAAHATCFKLTKYFERADLMDFMFLTNLMDPRFKDNVIVKNLGLHSTRDSQPLSRKGCSD